MIHVTDAGQTGVADQFLGVRIQMGEFFEHDGAVRHADDLLDRWHRHGIREGVVCD
ncbi:hypothetical protein [Pseudonocardia sp.]|uniref:hypothetical protein n=1 Tax=Pseudonocardia sp. TaxID=60912 RepID=UPI0031FD8A39